MQPSCRLHYASWPSVSHSLFVTISQVIGCEDRLRNDLYCVGWGVKLYSLTLSFCAICACYLKKYRKIVIGVNVSQHMNKWSAHLWKGWRLDVKKTSKLASFIYGQPIKCRQIRRLQTRPRVLLGLIYCWHRNEMLATGRMAADHVGHWWWRAFLFFVYFTNSKGGIIASVILISGKEYRT